VILFEHTLAYPMEDEVADDAGAAFDAWHAVVRRAGSDVSLVTSGGSLTRCLAAAETLAGEGIAAEVIDLRVLRPFDTDTVLRSVAKTRRAVVIDEGWKTCGLAAELAACIGEHAFGELVAPVARVCSAEVPIPYAKHLEDAALPSAERIVAVVRRMVAA
jgi:pyruvate dehydrogenase E1 component beta subunit